MVAASAPQKCPHLCEKRNGKIEKQTKGTRAIYARLQELNVEARRKVCCIIFVRLTIRLSVRILYLSTPLSI